MDRSDTIFCVLIAAICLWQILLLLRGKREITMRVDAPGRMGGIILCVVILAVVVWRRGNIATSWPVYVGMVVMMALYLFAPVGLNSKGFFSTSRFIAYDDLVYFALEQPEAPVCRLRLSRSGGRETVLSITQEQRPQVEAWLLAAGVDTFEAYGASVREGRRKR